MRKITIIALYLFVLIPFWSCKQKVDTSVDNFTQEVYTPEYASGFKIIGEENLKSTIISIHNPWQNTEKVEMLYYIARDNEPAPAGFTGQIIQGGVKRIVCMSSSYIAMLDALGETNRVVGVSGMSYISNEYIIANKNSIKDLGAEISYETLVALAPDVVLLYGIDDAQSTVTDKLQELSIPYMYVGEYVEESPLGKAEWLIAIAELTDTRAKGIAVFQAIPERYNQLKALAENVTNRPTAMLNTPWNDSWTMPSVKSYIARLIADAGGDYIYKKNNTNGSQPIGLETAYRLIHSADYWINVGMVTTIDELKAVSPKFTNAKAVREKTVYNNNLRLTAGGGNDFWESAVVHPDVVLRDLMLIFHPELLTGELYYYRHLE